MNIEELYDTIYREAEKSSLYDLYDEEYVEFQIHAAIYTYASLNHRGQWSDLYGILCSSEFNPGHMWKESREIEENEFYPLVEQVCEEIL